MPEPDALPILDYVALWWEFLATLPVLLVVGMLFASYIAHGARWPKR